MNMHVGDHMCRVFACMFSHVGGVGLAGLAFLMCGGICVRYNTCAELMCVCLLSSVTISFTSICVEHMMTFPRDNGSNPILNNSVCLNAD
jgi:hypothetical protein